MPPLLSFTTMGTPGRSLPEIIELARRFSFQGVDLRFSDHLGDLRPGMTEAQLRDCGRQLRDAGLQIPTLLCYANPAPTVPEFMRGYVETLTQLLDVAEAAGATAIRLFGLPEGSPSSAHTELVDMVKAACVKRPGGAKVVLQNHRGTSGARECVELVQRFPEGRGGIAYAPDHGLAYDALPIAEQWQAVAPVTTSVYCSDLIRTNDGFLPCLPGAGEVPLLAALRALRQAGFAGFVSLKWEKIWHPTLPEVEVAIEHFLRLLTELAREG